jgi:multicomponent K+:H+ antiporter subunit D
VIVFLVKSAMWPLGFWLPTAYAAASPPVAAMFVLMTKVGVYTTLRVWLPVFGEAGDTTAFGHELLFWGGIATVVFGAAGMLASESHDGQLAGYAAIASSGTLLAAIGYGQGSLVPALLFYLLSSTLAVAAFVLLIELIERSRNPIQSILEVTREAFDFEETPEQPVGIGIPAAVAFVGLSFAGCAVVIAALPPLSGFIAKFSMLHTVLAGSGASAGPGATAIVFISILILSGLAAIVALTTYGIRNFWGSGMVASRLYLSEAVPIGILLLACALLTVYADPVFSYLKRTGEGLRQPGLYSERVLSAPVVERAGGERQ